MSSDFFLLLNTSIAPKIITDAKLAVIIWFIPIEKFSAVNIFPVPGITSIIADRLGNVISVIICFQPFTFSPTVIKTTFTIVPTTYCEFDAIQLFTPKTVTNKFGIIIGTKNINMLNTTNCIISFFFDSGYATWFKQFSFSINYIFRLIIQPKTSSSLSNHIYILVYYFKL